MRANGLFKWADRWIGIPLVWLLSRFSVPGPTGTLKPGARVLFIKFSAMGDTLLLLPFLKEARRQLGPGGRLEMIATPVNQGVLKNLAWLDALHIIQPAQLLRAPWHLFGLLFGLRRKHFDVVIDFDQWLRVSALLSLGSGAKLRVGFKTQGQAKHFLFHRSAANTKDRHEFLQFGELFGLAGFEGGLVEPYDGFLKREGFFGAREMPRGAKKLIVLHPGTGGKKGWQREWPVTRYAELGMRLHKELGVQVALSGAGQDERELCAELEAVMGPADESCIDTGLKSLVETLCRADLLVCGNTGVMHLAAGLGTPTLALHGPNPVIKWGPLSAQARVILAKTACSPCLSLGFEFGCPLRPCMESISVDETEKECAEMLA